MALCKTDSASKFSLIYVDTMCISRDKEIRTKAINTMGQVYETASVTMMLNASLKAISLNSCSTAKLVVRLLTSPWNHRLWTFQDARLAHKLVFVFQDGLCEIGELWGRARRSIPAPISLQCRLMLARISKGKKLSLSSIAMLLRRRSTSNPADEFPALAQVFNVPIEALTSKEGLEQCCEFWIQLKKVPCSIVFQTQDKIPRDDFRWAPQSLIGSKVNTLIGSEGEAVLTTKDDLRGTDNLLVFSKPHYFDFTLHRNYHLISVSRRQVFRLTGLSWALHKIRCDAVLVEVLKPNSNIGHQTSAAVCLSRTPQLDDLNHPQYEYKLRLGINHGLRAGSKPVIWDKAPDGEYLPPYVGHTHVLCEAKEMQTIYIREAPSE